MAHGHASRKFKVYALAPLTLLAELPPVVADHFCGLAAECPPKESQLTWALRAAFSRGLEIHKAANRQSRRERQQRQSIASAGYNLFTQYSAGGMVGQVTQDTIPA